MVEAPVTPWRRRAARRGHLVAPGAAAAALVLIVLDWTGLVQVLVLAGRPVPSWWVPLGLLALGLASGLATRRRREVRTGAARRARLALVLVAGAAVLLTAVVETRWERASYQVLSPVGPDGCRIVVVMGGLILPGDGTLYSAAGRWGPARRVGEFVDGDLDHGPTEPFARGDYTLSWDDAGVGTLVAGGDVRPADHRVGCR